MLTAFVNPGDEVIMFEPFFDQYLPSVVFNGGKCVYVPLHPDPTKPKPTSDDWKLDFDELRYVLPDWHSIHGLTRFCVVVPRSRPEQKSSCSTHHTTLLGRSSPGQSSRRSQFSLRSST